MRQRLPAVGLGLVLALAHAMPVAAEPAPGPFAVVVHTIPPVAGLGFSIDGRGFIADRDGVARTRAWRGMHTVAVMLPDPNSRTRIDLDLWADEFFTASRPLRLTTDTDLYVGLKVAYLTPIRFVDLDGHPLDPARVSEVGLSGPNAEIVQLRYPFAAVWLRTPMAGKHPGAPGLYVTPTPYFVLTARYDGLNVVNRGEQHFLATPGGVWSIALRLYRLRIHAQDALFGSTLTRPVVITNPAGVRQTLQLDQGGNAAASVGRGLYTARVLASGISPAVSVALTRNQSVVIPVVTPLDLGVLTAGTLAVLLFLYVVGRRRAWLGALRVPVLSQRMEHVEVGAEAGRGGPLAGTLDGRPLAPLVEGGDQLERGA